MRNKRFIRADANEKIGTGHVMRCLSIAEECRRRGEEVIFIIADDCPRSMVEQHGFSAICLDSVWNDMETEISSLIKVIKDETISVLLIDSYFVTEFYLKEIGRHTKVVYIDDLNQFIYPVDMLVNSNVYAKALGYEERYRKAGLDTKFILGCEYVPLRTEFSYSNRKIKESVSEILITSGGTDPYDVIGGILESFAEELWFDTMVYHVILGCYNKNKRKLEERWKDFPNVILLYGVKDMAGQMDQCDIAITAGGTTTYELCASGIPSIIYTLADNQLGVAREMSRLGVIPWAGDIRSNRQGCLQMIKIYVEKFRESLKIRQNVSTKMQRLVDGSGCMRFVDSLGEMGVQ